ncbi:hypothetical protein [Glaciimonas sp. PCH181]|uniref:hypothetical protein n=1 Tax=Glaciimonas sp. PCH181 TaxID=2133943 RepID=UPI000D3603A4|nr:hypothetical protein [Glaciimonas sp. PCH181]PUA16570.1 hypothetical protein C7W93_21415 [Glaciimonas sp. PCH181]
MENSVFLRVEFILLIAFSIVLPIGIFTLMLKKRAISRITVFLFSLTLIVLAGVNVVLLRQLAHLATLSSAAIDSHIFASEISIMLYLLPAVLAGVGVNVISHLLIAHLKTAEEQFDENRVNNSN